MLGHNLKTTPRYEVDPVSGCWNTLGGKTKGGYGKITHARKTILLHRWMYEQANGPIPDGRQVHHKCHNPPCCNPEHLQIVGRLEHRRLDRQYKLSDQDVRDIRLLATFKVKTAEIARRYGVTHSYVSLIISGRKGTRIRTHD